MAGGSLSSLTRPEAHSVWEGRLPKAACPSPLCWGYGSEGLLKGTVLRVVRVEMPWQRRHWLSPGTVATVTSTASAMRQALWLCQLIQVSRYPGEVRGQDEATLGPEPWWSGLGTRTLDQLLISSAARVVP